MPGPSYPWSRPGQFNRICDRTGFKVLADDTREEWTGRYVRSESFEHRHPQDFLKGKKDLQAVHDARPEATDNFLTAAENTRDAL